MNRYEQISLATTGDLHAHPVINVVVALAHKNRFHAGFVINSAGKHSSDCQRHVLFSHSGTAYRTRVKTTMPGIDRNDDIPAVDVTL